MYKGEALANSSQGNIQKQNPGELAARQKTDGAKVLGAATNAAEFEDLFGPEAKIRELQADSTEYLNAEKRFARRISRLSEVGQLTKEKYRSVVEQSENGAEFYWRRLERSTDSAVRSSALKLDPHSQISAQKIEGTDPQKQAAESIEAASSIFFEERMDALRHDIREDATLAEADKKVYISVLNQTWSKVAHYLDAYSDRQLRDESPSTYDEVRWVCHNDMISQLNALNQLAEQRGQKRFTLRDFRVPDRQEYERGWASRFDPDGAVRARTEYDRYTVYSYFRGVYAKDFDAADAEILKKF